MNPIWKNLPPDIKKQITTLHYHTIHQKYYKNVQSQLLYYQNEFNYERQNNIFSIWYRATPSNYIKYALFKCNLKKEINLTSANKSINHILHEQLTMLQRNIQRQ